jgi:hypothetical protein
MATSVTYTPSTKKNVQIAMICDDSQFSLEQLKVFHDWYAGGYGFNTQVLQSIGSAQTSIVNALLNFPNYVLMEDKSLLVDPQIILATIKSILLSPNLGDDSKIFVYGPEADLAMCDMLEADQSISENVNLSVIPIRVDQITTEMGKSYIYVPQICEYTLRFAEQDSQLLETDIDWLLNTNFEPVEDFENSFALASV